MIMHTYIYEFKLNLQNNLQTHLHLVLRTRLALAQLYRVSLLVALINAVPTTAARLSYNSNYYTITHPPIKKDAYTMNPTVQCRQVITSGKEHRLRHFVYQGDA